MGNSGLDQDDERAAMGQLIGKSLAELEAGVALVESVRLGRATACG